MPAATAVGYDPDDNYGFKYGYGSQVRYGH
jgi:hypothetical protein